MTANSAPSTPFDPQLSLGGEGSGIEEIRGPVRRDAAAGASVIKAVVTDGGLTKGGAATWESQFTDEELRAPGR